MVVVEPVVTKHAAEQASGLLSEEQTKAWEALLSAHGVLTAGLERALGEAGLPPASWLDVLARLEQSSDRTARPRDLGCGIQISRSGLTRLLDRMEATGAVERRRCDEDRRGSYIAITDSGLQTFHKMKEVVEAELSDSFASQLDDEQARELTDLLVLVGAAA